MIGRGRVRHGHGTGGVGKLVNIRDHAHACQWAPDARLRWARPLRRPGQGPRRRPAPPKTATSVQAVPHSRRRQFALHAAQSAGTCSRLPSRP
ncbi:hypothetical protein PK63_09620 [Xanthomonas phaseoli pv. phaseoli]|nr:hypothetical protein PK63_09620 [Xanthomonas phaseoli pv. phaseoli]KII98626.1 hypothetical protein ST33_14510 [Xanthomonas citri pv. fuscans]